MKKILSLFTLAAIAFTPLAFAQDSTVKSREVYAYAGAPVNGTNEVDTLTIQSSTSALVFTLTVTGGQTSAPITWSATNATLLARVDAALEAMSVIGIGGVTTAEGSLTAGIGTITLTFVGKNAAQNFPALTLTEVSRTGGTAATVSTTTAGVAAIPASTLLWPKPGDILEDTTNGDAYQNISTTALAPNWQPVRPMGFKTGAGGAVTQITSRATTVVLSTRSGKITTTADSLAAATIATFTVTNTTVAATDTVSISKVSGDVDTFAWVNSVAAGSFTVSLYNSHASAADTTAFVLNFNVIRGAID